MIRGIKLKSRRKSLVDICKEAGTDLKSFDIEGYRRLTHESLSTVSTQPMYCCYEKVQLVQWIKYSPGPSPAVP